MSNSEAEKIKADCVAIFREKMAISHTKDGRHLSDGELLVRPFEGLDVDSLSIYEFVMSVEDRFEVMLDEAAVNQCKTITDLADLVYRQRHA